MSIADRCPAGLFLFVILVAVPLTAQSGGDPGARVDAVFADWATRSAPGCAVAADLEGLRVLERAYGLADLEHGVANSPGTIFEAGSVSKQFTAAAIILLALDGALSLDDDVRRYVPELPDYGDPITIRHLLNHTSGLRDWGSVAALSGWGRGERTHSHDHVLEILSRQSALNYGPGEAYSYTNSGYNLLAVIVDRVSGQSFADFSRTRIFEPLGLSDTAWRDDYRRIVPGRAAAYSPRDDGWAIDRPIEHVHGNGGLLTTVHDLLRWDRALAAGELGGAGNGPELVRLMHEQGVLNDGTVISYAAGLQIGTRHGVPQVVHTGATAGYRAFLGRYPDQQLSVALLCNTAGANPGALGGQVVDLLLEGLVAGISAADVVASQPGGPTGTGLDASDPAPRYEPTPDQLAGYVGSYHSADAETTFTVTIEEGALVVARRPASRFVLQPVSADLFRGPGLFRFHRDADGRVTQLGVEAPRVHDIRFQRLDD
jgi:CubicO group peptidase (beta-lactamase class C family)